MIIMKETIGDFNYILKKSKSNGYVKLLVYRVNRDFKCIHANKISEPKNFLKKNMDMITELKVWIGANKDKIEELEREAKAIYKKVIDLAIKEVDVEIKHIKEKLIGG